MQLLELTLATNQKEIRKRPEERWKETEKTTEQVRRKNLLFYLAQGCYEARRKGAEMVLTCKSIFWSSQRVVSGTSVSNLSEVAS